VGFLGAAQIDRWGNINTTVVGPYDAPAVRLPGAGGAPEIATACGRVLVIVRQSPRAFVESLSFRTSVGDRITSVITDLGVLDRGCDDGELVLRQVHPGASVEDACAATGWPLRVAADVAETEPPTTDELGILRELQAAREDAA
jgi:glutaconate CoA-transferase subunit B